MSTTSKDLIILALNARKLYEEYGLVDIIGNLLVRRTAETKPGEATCIFTTSDPEGLNVYRTQYDRFAFTDTYCFTVLLRDLHPLLAMTVLKRSLAARGAPNSHVEDAKEFPKFELPGSLAPEGETVSQREVRERSTVLAGRALLANRLIDICMASGSPRSIYEAMDDVNLVPSYPGERNEVARRRAATAIEVVRKMLVERGYSRT